MDSPRRIPSQKPQLILSPCSSGRRRRISDSPSPEFEFWMVRNPSFPQSNLLSADDLFVDGVLLPLHLLHLRNNHRSDPPDPPLLDPHDPPNSQLPQPKPEPGPQISNATPLTASKRWKDILKKGDKKTATTRTREERDYKEKEKEKKREKKNQTGASPAELNINIWPFSRSRSAGNSGARPRMFPGAPGTRKVSSAPCSRSNSAGESKSRKWPSSPGRSGVHLGRSSPVWQVRRGAKSGYSVPGIRSNSENIVSRKEFTESRRSKTTAAAAGDGGGGGSSNTKTKVLNLNVPICMGYRQHLSCRSDENSAIRVSSSSDGRNGGGGNGGNGTANVGSGGNLFNLRSLFTKKVY